MLVHILNNWNIYFLVTGVEDSVLYNLITVMLVSHACCSLFLDHAGAQCSCIETDYLFELDF